MRTGRSLESKARRLVVRSTTRACAVLLSVALLGCSGGVDEGLRSYTENVLTRKAKPLERPRPPDPYQVFIYSAEGVDPFKPFFQETEERAVDDDSSSQYAPAEGRLREELEGFPLDALTMKGTLEQDSSVWGILVNRDGTVYRVQVGNYLGQNHGKIIAILEDEIEVEERARDSRGKWYLREASIALAE